MYPLAVALEIAGVKPGKFHRHFYGGALGNTLAEVGELVDHISQPMRGAGAGRGGGRFITLEGTICLGVFFRLISGGVHSSQAIRIAETFTFLGEAGEGLRAFKRNRFRPAGNVFPGNDETFLVAISDNSAPTNVNGQGFAFVPGSDMNAVSLAEWLGLQDADKSPVCVFNLSEVCRDIRRKLELRKATAFSNDPSPDCQRVDWSEMATDPVGAFLADCAIRDDKARTPTQEFLRAFTAWHSDWTGAPSTEVHGSKAHYAALQKDLLKLGIRKVKSNGIMTFAGFRWRDTPAVRAFLLEAHTEE